DHAFIVTRWLPDRPASPTPGGVLAAATPPTAPRNVGICLPGAGTEVEEIGPRNRACRAPGGCPDRGRPVLGPPRSSRRIRVEVEDRRDRTRFALSPGHRAKGDPGLSSPVLGASRRAASR